MEAFKSRESYELRPTLLMGGFVICKSGLNFAH